MGNKEEGEKADGGCQMADGKCRRADDSGPMADGGRWTGDDGCEVRSGGCGDGQCGETTPKAPSDELSQEDQDDVFGPSWTRSRATGSPARLAAAKTANPSAAKRRKRTARHRKMCQTKRDRPKRWGGRL